MLIFDQRTSSLFDQDVRISLQLPSDTSCNKGVTLKLIIVAKGAHFLTRWERNLGTGSMTIVNVSPLPLIGFYVLTFSIEGYGNRRPLLQDRIVLLPRRVEDSARVDVVGIDSRLPWQSPATAAGYSSWHLCICGEQVTYWRYIEDQLANIRHSQRRGITFNTSIGALNHEVEKAVGGVRIMSRIRQQAKLAM